MNLTNPVIAFLDPHYSSFFKQLRSDLPKELTKVHTVDTKKTWAFSLENRIAEVFRTQKTVKSYPNTVNPKYSCTMHAKYEFMLKAINENPFKTKYFCWLDAGLFRDMTVSRGPLKVAAFSLYLPPNFNDKKVSYNQVYKLNPELSVQDVFFRDYVTISGGFFIGKYNILSEWSSYYMHVIETLLSQGLMSTDQQVLTAICLNDTKACDAMQKYVPTGIYNPWFYLAYVCRDQGDMRRKELSIGASSHGKEYHGNT